jgi:predicted enzyme related to lactoylglutathione lyase
MGKTMNPVGWFEIPASNLPRAQKFYEQVFETKLSPNEMGPVKMAWFPMENAQNNPGCTGTLIKAENYAPSHQGTLIYFTVPSIEKTLERIGKSGGKTLMPKTSIGEHGFIAHFEDCEGNRIALHAMQ